MSRIACLRIPRFPIVVHQKQEPELKKEAFVLVGGRSEVFLCSPEASRRYVRPGMRLSEARAVCSELRWRDYDDSLYIAAQKEMIFYLVECSPRVSAIQIGMFLMDADGLALLGGENLFARNIIRFVSQKGYTEGCIGIADSAFAATVAAQQQRRWQIVAPGKDSSFLSSLSVDYLPISLESKDTLYGLGVERMGQLTALPYEEVTKRFEKEGVLAYELASGIDRRRPSLPKIETSYQCYVDMGGPIESLNDTLFVIKSMLERLTSLLKQAGLCAEELTMCFYSDDDLFEERPVRLIRPSNQGKFLLEVLRLSIENKQLEKEFTSLRLIISKTTPELFKQVSMLSGDGTKLESPETRFSSDSFLLLVQKLNTRYGENALLRPVAIDHYTPERAGAWQPAIGSQGTSLSVAVDYVKESAGNAALVSGLVLKRYAQPRSILVEVHKGQPETFTSEGVLYKIHRITTPECLSGLWWEQPVRKSYYTALVQPSSGNDYLLVMLVYDHECKTWFVEGEYD